MSFLTAREVTNLNSIICVSDSSQFQNILHIHYVQDTQPSDSCRYYPVFKDEETNVLRS